MKKLPLPRMGQGQERDFSLSQLFVAGAGSGCGLAPALCLPPLILSHALRWMDRPGLLLWLWTVGWLDFAALFHLGRGQGQTCFPAPPTPAFAFALQSSLWCSDWSYFHTFPTTFPLPFPFPFLPSHATMHMPSLPTCLLQLLALPFSSGRTSLLTHTYHLPSTFPILLSLTPLNFHTS